MSETDPFTMSDEIRLQLLKAELKDLFLIVKMELTVKTTLEAYKQYLTGELPEQFKDYVGSDTFKEILIKGINAQDEILKNFTATVINMARLFGIDFEARLPQTPEDFMKMTENIKQEVVEKMSNEAFWNNKNDE